MCVAGETLFLQGVCEQVGEAFSHCSPGWVNKGAISAPVLTGRHSAKRGICVTRDHTVTHSEGCLSDSLRAQENDGGWGEAGKTRERKEKERGFQAYLVSLSFALLYSTDVAFFTNRRQDPLAAERLRLSSLQYSLRCGGLEPNPQFLP